MTLAEKLLSLTQDLTEDVLAEVIDFAEYLKVKKDKEHRKLVDEFIVENDVALKELAK